MPYPFKPYECPLSFSRIHSQTKDVLQRMLQAGDVECRKVSFMELALGLCCFFHPFIFCPFFPPIPTRTKPNPYRTIPLPLLLGVSCLLWCVGATVSYTEADDTYPFFTWA